MRKLLYAATTCGRMFASHIPSKKLRSMVSLYTPALCAIITCRLNFAGQLQVPDTESLSLDHKRRSLPVCARNQRIETSDVYRSVSWPRNERHASSLSGGYMLTFLPNGRSLAHGREDGQAQKMRSPDCRLRAVFMLDDHLPGAGAPAQSCYSSRDRSAQCASARCLELFSIFVSCIASVAQGGFS